ncbi:MAG: hypothetical protein AVDCRST_MAG56-4475 [uncultured Cytophagales bacterium]|uniref:Uncharacterized protein n=1 Tax=uncultured Cytophagales bacterium TaxID=158755 RepID=A0A6J4JWY8_9SPHI|nr:MAG: hypothetical protein AVDCRST_MAG56-4475 [uncultured Cytophagales bacterium]
MPILITDFLIREQKVVTFPELTQEEKTEVERNTKELVRLVAHLECAYHPRAVVRTFTELRQGKAGNRIFTCCAGFSALVSIAMQKSRSPYALSCSRQIYPTASN